MAGFYAGFVSQASLSSQAPYAPIHPYTMFDPNFGMTGFYVGSGNVNGTIITCQLCRQIGHGAKTCHTLSNFSKGGYNGRNGGFARNIGGNGNGNTITCQLCKQIGHGAKTCRTLSIFQQGSIQVNKESVMVKLSAECCIARERIQKLESEAEALVSKKIATEKLVSELVLQIDSLSKSSRSSENKMQDLLLQISALETENKDNAEKLQAELQKKAKQINGSLKEGEKHEQYVDLMDKQVSQPHITLEEKELLILQYKEREKNLEVHITENRTLPITAETRIVEDKKYDLMLESKQLELSRHLKDISQRNDQAINDIRKKYEVEKLAIVNMEKQKAEKIVNMEKQKAEKLVGETERDDLFLFHRHKKKKLELQCSRTVACLYLLMMLLLFRSLLTYACLQTLCRHQVVELPQH